MAMENYGHYYNMKSHEKRKKTKQERWNEGERRRRRKWRNKEEACMRTMVIGSECNL
jgi:hypothetical protein